MGEVQIAFKIKKFPARTMKDWTKMSANGCHGIFIPVGFYNLRRQILD